MGQVRNAVATDRLPWMPLAAGISARPLWFGEDARTLQLKVEPGATVGRHRHTGPVHAFNVSGWRKLSTGEVVGPGWYVFEPAGNEDCWGCVGDEPCVVQITLSGMVVYLDKQGLEESYTDTAKLRSQYLAWCRSEGLEPLAIGALQS